MEATGASRSEAEFILAQELGEIDGDVIVVDLACGPVQFGSRYSCLDCRAAQASSSDC